MRFRILNLWFLLLHKLRLKQRTKPSGVACFAGLLYFLSMMKEIWRILPALVLRMVSILIIVFVILTLYQQKFDPYTIIDDVSVPKILAERGYTGSVVAERLHDNINIIVNGSISPASLGDFRNLRSWDQDQEYAGRFSSKMRREFSSFYPTEDWEKDRPNFVVPGVGMSIETIASIVNGFLHVPSSHLSGELVELPGDMLLLTLRQHEKSGVPISVMGSCKYPDMLLKRGARKILGQKHSVILGMIFTHEGNRNAAATEYQEVIKEDPHNAFAYGSIGVPRR